MQITSTSKNLESLPSEILEIIWFNISYKDALTLMRVNKELSINFKKVLKIHKLPLMKFCVESNPTFAPRDKAILFKLKADEVLSFLEKGQNI